MTLITTLKSPMLPERLQTGPNCVQAKAERDAILSVLAAPMPTKRHILALQLIPTKRCTNDSSLLANG